MTYKKWQKLILLAIIIFALLGMTDSIYLSSRELTSTPVTCTNSWAGCNDVLTSTYANFFGTIPLSYTGVIFYLGILVLTLLLWFKKQILWLQLLAIGSLSGFIMSVYFIYIQLFEIYTICPYCMFSAINSTLIFVLSTFSYFYLSANIKIKK